MKFVSLGDAAEHMASEFITLVSTVIYSIAAITMAITLLVYRMIRR